MKLFALLLWRALLAEELEIVFVRLSLKSVRAFNLLWISWSCYEMRVLISYITPELAAPTETSLM